jgi:endonuclease YncB( thermonuclease family)
MLDLPSLDDPYVYNAELVRVLDGDTASLRLWKTFKVEMDFGFHIKEEVNSLKSTVMNFRLLGINTPETRGVPMETKALGDAATAELTRLLSLGVIRARTYKQEKFGRWLVDLWVITSDGESIHVNESLVLSGHAVEYMKGIK